MFLLVAHHWIAVVMNDMNVDNAGASEATAAEW